jgi:hypothetical protein
MKYIGQTGRYFHIRNKEHILDYKQGNMKSNFAKHLIEQRHTPGTIEDTMDVVNTTSKSRLLNVIEKFYIYRETKINNQINDRNSYPKHHLRHATAHERIDRRNITAILLYFHFC